MVHDGKCFKTTIYSDSSCPYLSSIQKPLDLFMGEYRPHVRDGLDVEKAGGDMYFSSDITSYNDTYHTLLWYVTNPRFNSHVRYES